MARIDPTVPSPTASEANLRDTIAIAAMTALLPAGTVHSRPAIDDAILQLCQMAYTIADAMLMTRAAQPVP